MALIKLVKGLSYSDGSVTVNRKFPVTEVPDGEVSRYLNTGLFVSMEGGGTEAEEDPKEEAEEDSRFSKMPEGLITLDDQLAEMSVKELKSYAADRGIDLSGATKKDAIIDRIVEADRKATEARAALRQD